MYYKSTYSDFKIFCNRILILAYISIILIHGSVIKYCSILLQFLYDSTYSVFQDQSNTICSSSQSRNQYFFVKLDTKKQFLQKYRYNNCLHYFYLNTPYRVVIWKTSVE